LRDSSQGRPRACPKMTCRVLGSNAGRLRCWRMKRIICAQTERMRAQDITQGIITGRNLVHRPCLTCVPRGACRPGQHQHYCSMRQPQRPPLVHLCGWQSRDTVPTHVSTHCAWQQHSRPGAPGMPTPCARPLQARPRQRTAPAKGSGAPCFTTAACMLPQEPARQHDTSW